MKTVKILHCADIHIGAAESFLGAAAEKRQFETLLTFEGIVDLCLEKGVQLLAISGDLFDSNRIPTRFVDAVFEKLASAAPLRVVFAAGNHDPLDAESPFLNRTLPSNLTVLSTEDEAVIFEDIGVRVCGRSFASGFLKGEPNFKIPVKADDYINIMVQHGELRSDPGSNYNSITPDFVKNSGMDYIALGHVHKRSEIGRMGNTFFAYCGCPEGQGFDELDRKGVYMGKIGKGVCDLEFVPVSKRQHIHQKIDITDCDGGIAEYISGELRSLYGEGYGENLYKIELVGSISTERDVNLSEIGARLSQELYFVKLKDSTECIIDTEGLAKETSLKGIFVKTMLERTANAPEDERHLYRKALKLGLKAFSGEVKYSED
ncbi:MAG: DNA repair exonuclease [Clostridia bacterium]|nr:DNA repair exonuclease [Clostridia bacterium]